MRFTFPTVCLALVACAGVSWQSMLGTNTTSTLAKSNTLKTITTKPATTVKITTTKKSQTASTTTTSASAPTDTNVNSYGYMQIAHCSNHTMDGYWAHSDEVSFFDGQIAALTFVPDFRNATRYHLFTSDATEPGLEMTQVTSDGAEDDVILSEDDDEFDDGFYGDRVFSVEQEFSVHGGYNFVSWDLENRTGFLSPSIGYPGFRNISEVCFIGGPPELVVSSHRWRNSTGNNCHLVTIRWHPIS